MNENITLSRTAVRPGLTHFVFDLTPSMQALERMLADVAATEIPVLLLGESGTGKEIVALEIHARSRHRDEPFLKWTSGTLATPALASLLPARQYGDNDAHGGGTIFLDNISELNQTDQNRVLQLLLESEGVSPGASQASRFVSATTQNLEQATREGRFREELYYRISGVCLRLPPLRERKEAIRPLLDFFLGQHADVFGRPVPQVSTSTQAVLMEYSWPGNIRELENVARKMVLLGDEKLVVSDLAVGASTEAAEKQAIRFSGLSNGRSLKEAAREASRKAEREMILDSLGDTRWNRKRTARDLHISYKALLYKMKQLGLDGTRSSEVQPEQASEVATRTLKSAGRLG
jgi:two-component system response regulator AtoC